MGNNGAAEVHVHQAGGGELGLMLGKEGGEGALVVIIAVDGGVVDTADIDDGVAFFQLGGIAGALHHAAAHGYDHVLSVPCDAPALPGDLRAILDAAGDAAFLDALPVVGWWPVSAATVIDRLLSDDGSRAVRAFADAIGAVGCRTGQPIANVNTPDDLAQLGRSPNAPVPR